MQLASRTADVLGQAGIPRFAPSQLDSERCTIAANESGAPPAAFRIARYPVTVGQYQRFVDGNGYQDERWWGAGGFGRYAEPEGWDEQLQFPSRPVVGVSWHEASAYCAWANSRLPTEVEWEWAARGSEGREYPWGNEEPDPSHLNCRQSGIGHPTPIGVYPLGATPVGIYDMAGNVWEWCVEATIRGGCWRDNGHMCRTAHAFRSAPRNRADSIGFRLATEVPGAKGK
jgi:formylglycine-generating enzyme required for sulfatase activity